MITIDDIRDLEKYLSKRFSAEPTVNVHIVTGECPGDTVAVEIIPDTPDDEPWVAFFSLTFDDDGHTDGIQGTAYDHWDPENSSPLWWQSDCGMDLGGLPAQDSADHFAKEDFDTYMTDAFGGLYHTEAVAED